MQSISFFEGKKHHADDVEVSKSHRNTCIKYDALGFKGLMHWPNSTKTGTP